MPEGTEVKKTVDWLNENWKNSIIKEIKILRE